VDKLAERREDRRLFQILAPAKLRSPNVLLVRQTTNVAVSVTGLRTTLGNGSVNHSWLSAYHSVEPPSWCSGFRLATAWGQLIGWQVQCLVLKYFHSCYNQTAWTPPAALQPENHRQHIIIKLLDLFNWRLSCKRNRFGWDHQLHFVLSIHFCFNSYILFAKNNLCYSILVVFYSCCSNISHSYFCFWSTTLKLDTNYTQHRTNVNNL